MKILFPTHTFSDTQTDRMPWNTVNALARNETKVYVISNWTELNIDKKELHPNIKLYTINHCQRSTSYDKKCLIWSWLFSLALIIIKRINFIYIIEASLPTPWHKFRFNRLLSSRILTGWNYDNPRYGKDLIYDRARKKEEAGLTSQRKFHQKLIDFIFDKIFVKFLKVEKFWEKADIVFYHVKKTAKKVGLPDKKIFYLPNGADINKFAPHPKDKNLDKFIFLFAGYISKRKGVEYLIRAFNKLIQESKNLELYLIGPGALDTLTFFKKIATTSNIKFLGRISPDKITEYYNQSDAFILPTLGGDSFSVAITEAMACGKPIITTNEGGIMNFFEPGKMGYLVESADIESLYQAMKKMSSNPDLAKKMGDRNREYATNNLTWDHVAKIIIQAFKNL